MGIASLIKFPPVQYIHPFYMTVTDKPWKAFGSVEGYFKVLRECGLWDFDNDCMLEDHMETCGKFCKRTDSCSNLYRM